MKTLEEEWTATNDELVKKAKISIPDVIIEEIVSRFPVKSILQFKTVSKPWLKNISNPYFTKLHFTRSTAANRTALFISAYDRSASKIHLLSAARDGGPLTPLITLDVPLSIGQLESEHLNGLISFTFVESFTQNNSSHVFVLNPSTRNIFRLPDPAPPHSSTYGKAGVYSFFGFDESTNEHKILMIRKLFSVVEVMLFSMSSYSWRKIDAEPPLGSTWDGCGVCVNNVVHMMPSASNTVPCNILGFDLTTEKFTILNTPPGVAPDEINIRYNRKGELTWKCNAPCIIKIGGCIGVACHERVIENNEMDLWILQDYEKRVWEKETITFPESWINMGDPYPLDSVNMDEVIFAPRRMSMNDVMSVLIYNRKSRRFKSLQFTHGLCSKTLTLSSIKCYVESMVPLPLERDRASLPN